MKQLVLAGEFSLLIIVVDRSLKIIEKCFKLDIVYSFMVEKIYFITGNKNKFSEIKAIIPEVEQLEIDLDEIQETDAYAIIKHKMKEALKHHSGPFIIEDTSLYIKSLNDLPGPLIKWFMQKLGSEGIYQLVEKYENRKAEARTVIGYAKNQNEIHFFEGSIKGEIVKPSGETNFGWDPIFKPNGHDQTFQQMTREEKNKISMRRIAAQKLKEFLENN
jgi:inosine triphosphate pyrophosphatase